MNLLATVTGLSLLKGAVETLTLISIVGGFFYFLISLSIKLNNLYRDLKRQDSLLTERIDKLQEKFELLLEIKYKHDSDIKAVARAVNNVQNYLNSAENSFSIRANDLIKLD